MPEMDSNVIPQVYFSLIRLASTSPKPGEEAIKLLVTGVGVGNITMNAAITRVLHHHANIVPYNIALIMTFLDRLHNIVLQADYMGDE